MAAFINSLLTNFSDPGVHFHAGLSDCNVNVGEAAELQCKLSSEECEGIWYKDGDEVRYKSLHLAFRKYCCRDQVRVINTHNLKKRSGGGVIKTRSCSQ